MSVPDLGDSSVIGTALERGFGHTARGPRTVPGRLRAPTHGGGGALFRWVEDRKLQSESDLRIPDIGERGSFVHSRNVDLAPINSIFVVTGLRPEIIAALPDAFERLVAAPRSGWLRFRWPSLGTGSVPLSVQAARAAARRSVHLVPPTLAEAQLVGHAHRTGYGGLPAALFLSGDRLALLLLHASADGTAAVEFVHELLEGAAGQSPLMPPEPVRFPVLRALRHGGRGALTSWWGWRREPAPPSSPAPKPTAAQRDRLDPQLVSFRLDADDLRRIRETRQKGSRATLNTRAMSIALAAVRTTYRSTADLCVVLPVDLRHHLKGGGADGNFMTALRVGGLLTADWSPSEIHAVVTRASFGYGIVTFAVGTVKAAGRRMLRGVARRRSRAGVDAGEYAVVISCVRSPRSLPEPVRDRSLTLSYATTGPWPAALFVLLWAEGDSMHVSVWNETDVFDLSEFETAFRSEIERRRAPRMA